MQLFRRLFADQRQPSTDPLTQYRTEGYAIFRDVLDGELIAEARNHISWLQEKNPGVRQEKLGHLLMADDPFWVRLVGDERLLDIAAKFVGPNIALFASAYVSKPPGDGQPVLWHQDAGYWPLEPMDVVTLWLAVDDATPENGCMRVIPNTHTVDIKPILPRDETANVLGSSIDQSYVDESKAKDVILKAGDVSVHHPNLIHGSNANTSTRRRCGLTIRYIPTTTRIILQNVPSSQLTSDGRWPSAFLLRGSAPRGLNEYVPRPKYKIGAHMPFHGCDAWT